MLRPAKCRFAGRTVGMKQVLLHKEEEWQNDRVQPYGQAVCDHSPICVTGEFLVHQLPGQHCHPVLCHLELLKIPGVYSSQARMTYPGHANPPGAMAMPVY